MWLGQSKIAIFILAAMSECLIYAEAKYCAFEIHGEPKYYVCPRTEYCCNFGCCVSPGFQIYHLWYYWLLVIIMFLVCSGGGWWYRYWLQGRYRPSTSTVPPRTSNSRSQSALRGPTCRAQQARVTYNPARNTVLLHRMWKGPQRNTTPPAYNGAAASSAQFQNTNVVLNDNNCPYYELYGPPPSYETVIAQTRGKIMSPTPTLEGVRTNAQTSPSIQNQNIEQCFSHNSYSSLPTRVHVDNGIGDRRNSCGSNMGEGGESYQSFGYKTCDAQQVLRMGGSNVPLENLYQENTALGTRCSVPQNILKMLPFCVPENRGERREEGVENGKFGTNNLGTIERNDLEEYGSSRACGSGQFTQNCMTSQEIENIGVVRGSEEEKLSDLEIGIMETGQPSDENHTRLDSNVSRIPQLFTYSKEEASGEGSGGKYNRAQSSSLKLKSEVSSRVKYEGRYCDVHRHREESNEKDKRTEESSSSLGLRSGGISKSKKKFTNSNSNSNSNNSNSNCEECKIAQERHAASIYYSQQNPSNNVILPSPNPNVQINSLTPINIIENYQHYPPTITSPTQRTSTSTNFESENKLGRSKSLD